MKYQGISLTRYLITLIVTTIVFTATIWALYQHPEYMDFINNPLVSFISWAISFVAGLIAIFEFSSYKNMEAQNNKLEKENQALKIQVKNKTTNITGSGTYVEKNDGGMNISHG